MPVLRKARSQPAATHWPAISHVSIENLFGRYTYQSLNFRRGGESDVAILYGDNGVGKTTILKLIYSALSPVAKEGNRTYLSKTRFSSIRIFLMNGSVIEITKEQGNLLGSYVFRIDDFQIKVNADRAHNVRDEDNPNIDKISEKLSKIKLEILFLADDRTIKSTYDIFRTALTMPDVVFQGDTIMQSGTVIYPNPHFSYYDSPEVARRRFQDIDRAQTVNLSQMIEAVREWLGRKTRQRTSSGDENASNVYLSVVETLSARGETQRSVDRGSLLGPLDELNDTVKRYQRFGLVGSYPLAEFIKIVQNAPDHRIPDIANVLSPYIDSLVTRLSALDEVRQIMATFEEEMDSYLRDKSLSIHVDHELRFFDDRNTNISPQDLSSGERQLLFLFCAALMSRDGNSIFIIDEPELSLNVKWQRRLVSSLSKLASGAATQFVMATHSIEILSQNRNSVIELN